MTDEETKNKTIALFDGWQLVTDDDVEYFPDGYYLLKGDEGNIIKDLSEMEYHSSFDWIMPVVGKLEEMGFTVEVSGRHSKIVKGDIQCLGAGFSKLNGIYLAVFQTIKTLNEGR